MAFRNSSPCGGHARFAHMVSRFAQKLTLEILDFVHRHTNRQQGGGDEETHNRGGPKNKTHSRGDQEMHSRGGITHRIVGFLFKISSMTLETFGNY